MTYIDFLKRYEKRTPFSEVEKILKDVQQFDRQKDRDDLFRALIPLWLKVANDCYIFCYDEDTQADLISKSFEIFIKNSLHRVPYCAALYKAIRFSFLTALARHKKHKSRYTTTKDEFWLFQKDSRCWIEDIDNELAKTELIEALHKLCGKESYSLLLNALFEADSNTYKAAKLLGVSHQAVSQKLEKIKSGIPPKLRKDFITLIEA